MSKLNKIYLQVPFQEKDQAKALGAKWDWECRSWYYTNPDDAYKFSKWSIPEGLTINDLSDEQKELIQRALSGENVLVDACIGSGKTTAIQVLCSEMKGKKILYLTYNRLLRLDAEKKIKSKNVLVKNYHAFANMYLSRNGIKVGPQEMVTEFNKQKPQIDHFDMVVIDEYQDITEDIAELLEYVKTSNKGIQIIAVGDLKQKIYDWTTLNVPEFMNQYMETYITMSFTKCFRLSAEYASKLGNVWGKNICGVNPNCRILSMHLSEVIDFLGQQNPEDFLCLGSRQGDMIYVLNMLESKHPEKFNKFSVYAEIKEKQGNVDVPSTAAIFSTYDGSKGLERKICVVFDFSEHYWESRATKAMVQFEILRNLFLVAASRGKEQIIFVSNSPFTNRIPMFSFIKPFKAISSAYQSFNISEMFDFKLLEQVEECYQLLNIRKLSKKESQDIGISGKDGLIDLSPCVGIYQEASFFSNYDIDDQIRYAREMHKDSPPVCVPPSADMMQKVLALTAIETRQERYASQVNPDFITQKQKDEIFKRLRKVFSPNENVQNGCAVACTGTTKNGIQVKVFICGRSDVVKNNIVYELKYVSALQHSHFLQAACYMLFLNQPIDKAILFNVRTEEQYEITISDVQKFLDTMITAITKGEITSCTNVSRV